MKKITILLFMLMTAAALLSSCNTGGEVSGAGTSNNEYTVFTSEARISLITSPATDRDSVNRLSAAINATLGYTPLRKSASSEVGCCEIVLGNTERKITAQAMAALTAMEDRGAAYPRYLVYADGDSLAIVFDATKIYGINITALTSAVTDLIDLCFADGAKKEVKISHGVVLSGYMDLGGEQEKLDEQIKAGEWSTLKYLLRDCENGDAIYDQLEALYATYEPGIVSWLANLYEPHNCYCGECEVGTLACYGGGFYYSNSARDNEYVYSGGVPYRLMADAESTAQAIALAIESGMVGGRYSGLPTWMKEQVVHFLRELQDENGFFYHPQWTKEMTDASLSRRGRDLGSCTSMLSSLGSMPKYDAPNGAKGEESLGNTSLTTPLGGSIAVNASRVVLTATYAEHLESDETFRAYLAANLPSDATPGGGSSNGFYWIGSMLNSQLSQIKERDLQLAEAGADYSLADILIEWLNTYQNSETGHWSTQADYAGTNGLLKISGIYSTLGVAIPYADTAARSAIGAITSDEAVESVVDIYNTWYAAKNVIKNIKSYGANTEESDEYIQLADRLAAIKKAIYEVAPVAIEATIEKINIFKKADGSFSYLPDQSSPYSQGMPVAIPGSNEGDVNATVICTTGIISNLCACLELSYYPPIFYGADKIEFSRILHEIYSNP
jgi:predicted small secreted protein